MSDLRREISTVKLDNERWGVNFEDLHSRKIVEIH